MPTFREFAALVSLEPERLREKVNQLLLGKTNNVGEFTILASTSATVVIDELVSPASLIVLMPYSDAPTQNPQIWISDQISGQFTVSHRSAVAVAGLVRYAVIG